MKPLILLLIFLFSSVSVLAVGTSEVGRWDLSNNGTVIDLLNTSNLTSNKVLIASDSIGSSNVDVSSISSGVSPVLTGPLASGVYNPDGHSLVVWVKPNIVGSNEILTINNATNQGPQITGFMTRQIRIYEDDDLITSTGLNAIQNSWLLLTYTDDGTTKKLYVNQSLNLSKVDGNSTVLNNVNYSIGKFTDLGAGNGSFYCARIFDGVLTEHEIGSLYNGGDASCQSLETLLLNNLDINNCAGGSSNQAINISFFDEETPTDRLTTTLEAEFIMHYGDRLNTTPKNFSLSGNNNYGFCLDQSTTEFQADILFKYTHPSNFTHRYILKNVTLNNNTQYINAYNYDTSTGISDLKITVRSKSTFEPLTNIVAELKRKYVGEGVTRTVQMDESGDFGQIFYNIKEEDTDYILRFFNENNTQLKLTNPLKFLCDSGICTLTFLLNPAGEVEAVPDLGITSSFDNSTNILTVTWNDAENLVSGVNVLVTKEDLGGTTTICDQDFTTTSGTTTCNTTGYAGPYRLEVSSTASPEVFNYVTQFGDASTALRDLLGGVKDSSLIAGLIFSTIMLGTLTFGSAAGIVAAILGFMIMLFFNLLTFLTIPIVIALVLVTAVISHLLRKEETKP